VGATPAVEAFAAKLGSRMTAQAIARFEARTRHPLILAVLAVLYLERGDELLDLFDKLLRYADSRARRRVDEQRRKTARQRDELATLARQLSRILVESRRRPEMRCAPARSPGRRRRTLGRRAEASPSAATPPGAAAQRRPGRRPRPSP
jgi:hypothetical protein